jgi:hypothetical protein
LAGFVAAVGGLGMAGDNPQLRELRGKIVKVDAAKSILRVAIPEGKNEVQKEFAIGPGVRLLGGPQRQTLTSGLRDKHFQEGALVILLVDPTTMAVREVRVQPGLPESADKSKKAGDKKGLP